MKKIIGLILFFSQLSSTANSQDGIDFKVQYKPSHTYNQTLTQSSHSVMTYKGSKEFLSRLKEKRISNPKISDSKMEVSSVLKTGKPINAYTFPLTIEFIKTTSSNGKKEIPDGTKIYGHGSMNELPTVDSISSAELSQDFKDAIKKSVQSTFSQISLPEEKIKVGGKFKRESPLSIPVGEFTIDMTIVTTYKLVSVSNDTAYFDIIQTYKAKTDVSGHDAKAKGEGHGKLIFDMKNNFYARYEIDTNMETKLSMSNFSLEVLSTSSFIQVATITAD